MMKPFQVSKISEYRTELMGVATLLVFVVHSYDNGVAMPNYIRTICALGSLGVDIFLLVSGFGLWYSLTKMSENYNKGGLRRSGDGEWWGGGIWLVFSKIQKNPRSILHHLFPFGTIGNIPWE